MAVPCPRCGRGYDVTLFEFGRTIWCTCGSRVGARPRVRSETSAEAPRFFADAMLGGLARWLRLLGFDCAYEAHIPDADLVRRSAEEGRVILTRDRALPAEWRFPDIELVEAESTFDQLVEVVRRFALPDRIGLFGRCSVCNDALEAVAPEAVAERVPPRVRETQERFWRCNACGRVYWEGSHTARIKRVVERVLEAV